MSKIIFRDKTYSTLASGASIGATVISVQESDAAKFGTIGSDEVLYVVLCTDSDYEIVTVSGRTDNVLSCSALTKAWIANETRVIATLPKAVLDKFVRPEGDGQELSGHKLADYTEKTTDHGDIGSGETLTLSFGDGPFHKCNLTGNCTININSSSIPGSDKADTIVLDITDVNLYSITWGSNIEASNEFPSTLANTSRFLLTAKDAETDIDLVYSGGLSVCYPGSFHDNFTGTNGDAPDTDSWCLGQAFQPSGTSYEINNNKLRVEIPYNASDQSVIVASTFKVSGDLDIQVDYDEVSADNPSSSFSWPARFLLYPQTGGFDTYSSYFTICYGRDSSGGFMLADTTSSSIEKITSPVYASGKLRIIRSGSTLKGYYWTGSQWEWDGSTDGYTFPMTSSADMVIGLMTSADYDSGTTTDWDNVQVNLGTIIRP